MPYRLSDHAKQRVREMQVDVLDVVHAVDMPETDYPAPKKYGGCRVATRGELAVPYDPRTGRIITVLWNTAPLEGAAFHRGEESPYSCGSQELRHDDREVVRRALAARARASVADVPDGKLCLDCLEPHTTLAEAFACDDARDAGRQYT